MNDWNARFRLLGAGLFGRLRPRETLLLNLSGEDGDYLRFNRGKVRAAGALHRRTLRLELVEGARAAAAALPLGGEDAADLANAAALLQRLRDTLPHLPEDPFLNIAEEPCDTCCEGSDALPPSMEAAEQLIAAAGGLDLVGNLATGALFQGFANSRGQHNWQCEFSFLADWSVHDGEDAAVKQRFQGQQWDEGFVRAELAYARETLRVLRRPPKSLAPGRYRVFLAPEALAELMSIVGRDGFGLKAQRTRQSVLLRLAEGAALSPLLNLAEAHADGRTPRFTPEGFIKPERVPLVLDGLCGELLTGARSAREYGEAVTAAEEVPRSLVMAGGDLHQDAVMEALGTGIYISNLWYCNLSDRSHCRITGLTRFACLWVEDGRPVAPIQVMRFDESLYHVLGTGLLALTREQETLFEPSTYGGRSTATVTLPGALVEGFRLVL